LKDDSEDEDFSDFQDGSDEDIGSDGDLGEAKFGGRETTTPGRPVEADIRNDK
jgi:hypothetical protein